MDSIPKKISCDLVRIATQENGAHITIFEESLPSLSKRLAAHEIDLILANDRPSKDSEYSRFHAKLIGALNVIFVGHPRQKDLLQNFPRSLNNQPMIMPGALSPLRSELVEHFKIKHIRPRIIAEVDDTELQKMLVMQEHGFGAFPLTAVNEELKSGALIRLDDKSICHENLWFITTHRLVHNPLAKHLIEHFHPNRQKP